MSIPRILILSTDRNLLDLHSEVRKRFQGYASGPFALDVAVLGKVKLAVSLQQTERLRIQYFLITPWNLPRLKMQIMGQFSKNLKLVTCQDPFVLGYLGVLIKKHLKLPVLELQIHGDFLSVHWLKERWIHWAYRFLMRWTLRRSDQIRVVLPTQEAYYRRHYPKANIYTLPVLAAEHLEVFSDRKRNELSIPSGHAVALLVGRLVKIKNFDQVIKAFAQHRTKFQVSWHLLIVGDGPLKSSLQKLSQKLGVGDFVHFMGWQHQLADFYACSDFLILNSSYEGWGRVIVEAMTRAKPVLSTAVGCASDLIDEETGLLLKSYKANDLLVNFETWFELRSQWEQMGQAAQRVCQNYIARWQPAHEKQWEAWS